MQLMPSDEISVEFKSALEEIEQKYGVEIGVTPVIIEDEGFVACRRFMVRKDGKSRKLRTFANVEMIQDLHVDSTAKEKEYLVEVANSIRKELELHL